MEIKPVNTKGNQPWIFTERMDAEAEFPILWPPDMKSRVIGKDPDAGKYWGQKQKGTIEDEMFGWHHWLNSHEFEKTLGDNEGQGSLVCCRHTVRHDWDWATTSWVILENGTVIIGQLISFINSYLYVIQCHSPVLKFLLVVASSSSFHWHLSWSHHTPQNNCYFSVHPVIQRDNPILDLWFYKVSFKVDLHIYVWIIIHFCPALWRRKWQPTPVFLPGESHGQRSLVGCSPWGRTESDTTEVTAVAAAAPLWILKSPH